MKIYQHYSIFGFANSYIVGNEDAGKALVVDPAELSPTMIEKIEQHHFDLSGILITHDHIHHINGLSTIMKIYSPTIYASNARLLDFQCRKVKDGDVFMEAGYEIKAIAVPGHSQDSIVYVLGGLFLRIRQKLFSLPGNTVIFPGHGPPSTIATEKKANIAFQEGFAEQLRSKYDFFV